MVNKINRTRQTQASIKASKYDELHRKGLKTEGKFKKELTKAKADSHMGKRLAPPVEISLAQAQRLAKFAPYIMEASARHNVPLELICGVILQESRGKPHAKSPKGAMGLMQLIKGTAKRFGVKDPYNPKQNIEGGTRYLRFLLDRFKGDVKLALAGYNAGEGNVEKYGNKIPPFKETREYVPKVLGYTQSMIDHLSASRVVEEIPRGARRV